MNAASDSQRSQAAVSPTTGDWVLFSEDPVEGAVIDTVLPRRTAIVRRDPAISVTKQTLAANVDVVGILVGLDLPPNAARVERFLVLAADSGAAPMIVLTKGDLLDEAGRRLVGRELAAVAPGVDILQTSATAGWGLEELRRVVVPHRTFVALGPSGVGKSTLLNALVGAPVLAVGDVRGTDRAGRHTTVRRELVLMPAAVCSSTRPACGPVSLWEADLPASTEVSPTSPATPGTAGSATAPTAASPDAPCRRRCALAAWTPPRLERYQGLWDELAHQSEARAERLRLQSRTARGQAPQEGAPALLAERPDDRRGAPSDLSWRAGRRGSSGTRRPRSAGGPGPTSTGRRDPR